MLSSLRNVVLKFCFVLLKVTVFLAGIIDPVALDASAIYQQTAIVLIMLPVGISVGLSVAVSNRKGITHMLNIHDVHSFPSFSDLLCVGW